MIKKICKFIDPTLAKILYLYYGCICKITRKILSYYGHKMARLDNNSAIHVLFNRYYVPIVLRHDYVEYTASRYADGVESSRKSGYLPTDYHHLSKEYWINELNNNESIRQAPKAWE